MRGSSTSLLTVATITLLVVACGGKIEQSADGTGSGPNGAGTGSSNVGGARGPSTPKTTPTGSPLTPGSSSSPGSTGNGGTYVNGPLGFVVRDAFSFDSGPAMNRELRGIWLTSWSNACEKTNAVAGSFVLRIDFSEEAGSVPPGSYPLEGPTRPLDDKTAFAQVWMVTAAGCTAAGEPGARFESGVVTIEKSTPTGVVGSFQGIMMSDDGTESAIDGHFDAPRCPAGSNSCTPP